MSDHAALQPPVARRQPIPTTLHGQTLHDDYAWMRDKSSPEVIAHLTAENAWTAANMAPTEPLQKTLYAEMLSHIQETDESVPYPSNGWFYFTRTLEGSQYPIHCRRQTFDATTPEHILLDVNKLAEGQAFMAVGGLSISPDNKLIAYSTDNTGFRQYTLHIRDLSTNEDLPDTALRAGSFTWAADSSTLFYTTEDEQTKRHDKLFRHTVGSTERDPLIHEETDERFNLGVGRTSDRKYIMVEAGSHTTSEYRFFPSADPTAPLTLIAPRQDDQEYYPDHRDGLFYIRTNDTTRNFRIVTTPVATPDRTNWTEFYTAAPNIPIEDFDLFQSFCVITERKSGLPTLDVYDLTTTLTNRREITFPEPTYTAGSHVNAEFDTRVFRYSYTSLVAPASVYSYDIATNTSTLLKQQAVPGGFDPANYASERLWVPATDGVQIPVSLVYRRDQFAKDATNPLYVYGYGSYGYSLPVGFSSTRLSLLDRGLVLAYAHIRGGGELGDTWHDAGKMMVKRNTFTDFIAVTEALVQQKYGSPKRVAIEGGSAGGLLMGAVLNARPDLFRAVLSHVPFVDVMNTMLDATLPLTVAEYEEWGNPNEPEAFAYMLTYSPYENLDALAGKPLPSILVKTSLNDSQVMYWEPAKYVAKLRTLKQDAPPLLLHINMEAGHGGASGRYDYLKEVAFDYAFLLRELAV
ncbi:S9 family peptidase [Granulicella tundricola]|uniref:Oligopeptidase B n=1 Tax=Granulicella tundricola (strain ATCC BAA-1859 / DSM 23138 / MP5ACTX9) TaxID=1198114 RepID=E8WXJ0_GRATM|nr:S9 family peptidase [Granulicella tundricola]ADW68606.1 Oligopeptidase B [Granulicella tundricola MP5ACTX9]